MAEKAGTAVQIVKDPSAVKPIKGESLTEHINAIFDAVSRRAYEIFESDGQASGP